MSELPQNLLSEVNHFIYEDTFRHIDQFVDREDNFKQWLMLKLKPYYIVADQDIC